MEKKLNCDCKALIILYSLFSIIIYTSADLKTRSLDLFIIWLTDETSSEMMKWNKLQMVLAICHSPQK